MVVYKAAISDGTCRFAVQQLRKNLQAFSEIRLWTPDIFPSPDEFVGDFIEPVASTYAPKPVTGQWGQPYKVGTGAWATLSPIVTWSAPPSIPWLARGWLLLSQLGWFAAARFGAPVIFAPGDPPLNLRVRVGVSSGDLLGQTIFADSSIVRVQMSGNGLSTHT